MRLNFPLIVAVLLFCLPAFAQLPGSDVAADGTVAEAYLAKIDADGNAGEPATNFLTTDVPIFCVVRLVSVETATVKMNLIAVSVPGVKAETSVVTTAYTTKPNETIVNFTGKPQGNWVAGSYRADILVGDKLAVRLPFDVKKGTSVTPSNSFAPKPNRPAAKQRRKN